MTGRPPDRLTTALSDRYRIQRELGQGGMATVYLAEDLKHKRKVALKVLKPELAAVLGAERFVQEITTTASLQHPHILPLFDSGTADGFLFYVMPFIQGETLRDKLNRETQLGVDEALKIATDVADALHYAHSQGVIHRDIKPENVLLANGRPMVADFGIALAVSAAAGGRMTETGLSLGTPHYMSPEQATADKEISARSDVYSLASVLYEMLAGQPPHLGGSAQQIIMKIIAEAPQDVTALRKSVPPNVGAAIAKALEKLPADRFDSAAKFAEALANPAFTAHSGPSARGASGRPHAWNRVTAGMTALAAALALLLAVTLFSRPTQSIDEQPVVRFALPHDAALRVTTGSTRPFSVSPDGRTIVFQASTDSTESQLWVRSVDDPRARPLDGTAGGSNAAISPDGNWVAFVVGNRSLQKIRVTGGEVSRIAELDGVSAALSWASHEEIIFEQIAPDAGIHRVNANGGRPELVIPFDTAAGETRQRRPVVLRNSGIVVYGSYTHDWDEPQLALYRLSDGHRERLGIPGIGALALIDDRLIHSRVDGTLMAVALDVRAMRAVGQPIPLTPRVAAARTGTAVGLSEGGTLVYRMAGVSPLARLDLVDTSGTTRTIRGEFTVQGSPRFSPHGDRVVVGIGIGGIGARALEFFTSDLWTIDLATGEPTRVTSGNMATAPSWSSDGRRLTFLAAGDSGFNISTAHVDGSAPPTRLAAPGGIYAAASLVPDGKSVVVQANVSRAIARGAGLLRIWIDGSARVDTVIAPSPGGLRPEQPRVSPDGRWVAFFDRTTSEAWVRSLSDAALLQVSTTGTAYNALVWGPDSRRVYYAGPEGLVVIELQTNPTLAIVQRRIMRPLPPNEGYDLSPDGRTFVVVTPVRAATDVFVAVNWADEARRAWQAAGRE